MQEFNYHHLKEPTLGTITLTHFDSKCGGPQYDQIESSIKII
jgi:hypothetical protein